jgi:hypothetical protein
MSLNSQKYCFIILKKLPLSLELFQQVTILLFFRRYKVSGKIACQKLAIIKIMPERKARSNFVPAKKVGGLVQDHELGKKKECIKINGGCSICS